MAAIPLKPEYHPTLGRLLSPHWRAASRSVRLLVMALGIGLVGVAVAVVLTLESPSISYGGPTPFSFKYRGLHRTTPDPGGDVKVWRLRGPRLEDSFAVRPLTLPPYQGSLSGELPLYASGYIRALSLRLPGFELRGEGKTRVNTVPAYNILYTTLLGGRRVYGRNVLLLPERPGEREGVEIAMLTSPTANSQVTSPSLVASVGVLKNVLRTFTFT
jgi:hypothetical protein